jgi:hypothetical protein
VVTLDDKIMLKLSEISERLVRVETLLDKLTDDNKLIREKLNNHEGRLQDLEQHKSTVVSAKDIFTWAVMAAIALWGALK